MINDNLQVCIYTHIHIRMYSTYMFKFNNVRGSQIFCWPTERYRVFAKFHMQNDYTLGISERKWPIICKPGSFPYLGGVF